MTDVAEKFMLMAERAFKERDEARAQLAEHESNQRAYEEIIGKKTYREVADELALVESLQRRIDLECDSYAKEGWAAKFAGAKKALAEAQQLVVEANNSLYGSQGYFHSLNGGPFDKHHLSRGIENLKAENNRLHAALQELSK